MTESIGLQVSSERSEYVMGFNNEYRDSLVLIRHFTEPLKVANIDFVFEIESKLSYETYSQNRYVKEFDNNQTTLKKINHYVQ